MGMGCGFSGQSLPFPARGLWRADPETPTWTATPQILSSGRDTGARWGLQGPALGAPGDSQAPTENGPQLRDPRNLPGHAETGRETLNHPGGDPSEELHISAANPSLKADPHYDFWGSQGILALSAFLHNKS